MIRKDVLAEKVLEVISVDTGWSLTKTPNDVFVTGIKEIKSIPAIYSAVLEYEGKYYKIGTNRLEVTDSKTDDENCFLLILVAVAKELKRRGKNEANVFLALGLPLTRFGAEKKKLIDYVSREGIIEFSYEQESYKIEIKGAAVFPQCYAAVADKIPCFTKKTIIVDIGSWTIDIMPVVNKAPDESNCITIPKGLITCMRSINEQCVRMEDEMPEKESVVKRKIDFEDGITNRMTHWDFNEKQIAAVKNAIKNKVKADVILESFYPEIAAEKMEELWNL